MGAKDVQSHAHLAGRRYKPPPSLRIFISGFRSSHMCKCQHHSSSPRCAASPDGSPAPKCLRLIRLRRRATETGPRQRQHGPGA